MLLYLQRQPSLCPIVLSVRKILTQAACMSYLQILFPVCLMYLYPYHKNGCNFLPSLFLQSQFFVHIPQEFCLHSQEFLSYCQHPSVNLQVFVKDYLHQEVPVSALHILRQAAPYVFLQVLKSHNGCTPLYMLFLPILPVRPHYHTAF